MNGLPLDAIYAVYAVHKDGVYQITGPLTWDEGQQWIADDERREKEQGWSGGTAYVIKPLPPQVETP